MKVIRVMSVLLVTMIIRVIKVVRVVLLSWQVLAGKGSVPSFSQLYRY
jgi:hypothetical protein